MEDSENEEWEVCSKNSDLEAELPTAPEKIEGMEESEEMEESEKGDNSDKSETATGRVKKECPLPSCRKKVVHLPRHLRNVHKWDKTMARAAPVRFNLRKTYTFRTEDTANSGNRKRKTADNGPTASKQKNRVAGRKNVLMLAAQ